MAPKPITPRLHGILDYTTGAELLAAPALLGLGGTRTGRLLRIAGASHIGYSLLTKYELGVAKLLPYQAHLAIDAVAAAGLAAAPWVLGTKTDGIKAIAAPLYFGLFEAAAVALSDPVADQVAQAPGQPLVQTEDGPKATDGEVKLSAPDPKSAVMPDGAEANDAIGARTIGSPPDRTGPGPVPGVGGQLA